MNINSTVELSFDLTKKNAAVTISAKQRDNRTRSITVKLTQNGKVFRAPEGAEIKLCGTKPDSSVFELLPSIDESAPEGQYTFILTDNALSAEGRIRCEVKCSQADEDDVSVCSTEIFYIHNVGSAIIPNQPVVQAELQSVERATAAALSAADVAAETAQEILGAKQNGEFDGYTPVKGVDYWTEDDRDAMIAETAKAINDVELPDFWDSHVDDRVEKINALQSELGKDCFSFAVMTDMHYPSNLGKRSPLIAKKIMDKCDIRYALCLGDTQTRGCHSTRELVLAENEAIDEMLSPIRDRLLRTEGNHDGSYGYLDRDGNGEYNNTDEDGNYKEPAERETYVNSLTPAELHSAIYRKVGLVGDVQFDESGSGYYVDDTANKVRYIVLNTQCNDYELQADGTSKYPKMWVFRFTQSQLDMVIDALNSVRDNSWSVVVAGHCPLWQEIGDAEVMIGVLNAYRNKTAYAGEYAGTAGGAAYENLADPDGGDWKTGYRVSTSGISAQDGKTVCNAIPVKTGDVIRVKGVSFENGVDRVSVYAADGTALQPYYVSDLPNSQYGYSLVNDVHTFVILNSQTSLDNFRCTFTTPSDASSVIITKNQQIIEEAAGYDHVSVDTDFSEAKGTLIGYFAGHVHYDHHTTNKGFPIITTRCDAHEENTEELKAERIAGTITEQSFDIFTVDKKNHTVHATKIGAGTDRLILYK